METRGLVFVKNCNLEGQINKERKKDNGQRKEEGRRGQGRKRGEAKCRRHCVLTQRCLAEYEGRAIRIFRSDPRGDHFLIGCCSSDNCSGQTRRQILHTHTHIHTALSSRLLLVSSNIDTSPSPTRGDVALCTAVPALSATGFT